MGSWAVGQVLRPTHPNFRGKNVKNPLHDLKIGDSSPTWNLSQTHVLDIGIPESIQSCPRFSYSNGSNSPLSHKPNEPQIVVIVKIWRGKLPRATIVLLQTIVCSPLDKAACPSQSYVSRNIAGWVREAVWIRDPAFLLLIWRTPNNAATMLTDQAVLFILLTGHRRKSRRRSGDI